MCFSWIELCGVDGIDGILIKPGGQMDPITKEIVGTKHTIDDKFIQENPDLTPEFLQQFLITELSWHSYNHEQ